MNLILTEKPSVAADFAAALHCVKLDGYYQSDDWCIVHARGHLYEQFAPDDYDERYKKWQISDLPIIPEKNFYKPKKGAEKDIAVIKKCFKSNRVSVLYVATDPGREGEAIARIILYMNRWELPENIKLMRFWTAEALTRDTINAGLKVAKPLSEYDSVWEKAQIRSEIDWLIGMNYTRLFSCRGNQLYSFGRVQTPVLFKIYQTDQAISGHVKSKYWVLGCSADKEGHSLRFEYADNESYKTDKGFLDNILNGIKAEKNLLVKDVKVEDRLQKSPQLYNISSLQIDANRKYGYTAKQTTGIMQILYEEKKVLSYPRTPSRVMGNNDYQYLSEIYNKLGLRVSPAFNPDNKNIFDSSKLEDHHALIIIRPADQAALSQEEKNIYGLVLQRMQMVVLPDYEYKHVKVDASVKQIPFTASYSITVVPGWKEAERKGPDNEADDEEQKFNALIVAGETLAVSRFDIEEKETKPPKKETDASLIRWMEKNGIGTPATKYTIAETLLLRDYISRTKKAYSVTEKGRAFIDFLLKFDAFSSKLTPEYTKVFEERIEAVDWGIVQDTIEIMKKTITDVAGSDDSSLRKNSTAYLCPVCGGEVRSSQKDYWCVKCRFSLGKTIRGHRLSTDDLQALFVSKKATKEHKFKSAAGAEFKASLSIINGKLVFNFSEKKPVKKEKKG